MATILSARCPTCQTTIRFDDAPELGAFIVCEECESELEVVQIRPLKLSWVDDEEYDEEFDEFDYDDEDFDDEYEYDDDDDYDDD